MNMAFRGCTALLLLALASSNRLSPMSDRVNREASLPTSQRARETGWWPTSNRAAARDYVGGASCVPCHNDVCTSQQNTRMAHASRRASDTRVLTLHPRIESTQSGVETVIATDHQESSYTVRRGGEAITGKILWSMGDGRIGQTFVLQSGESLFESQLSYFPSILGLDLTPSHTWQILNDLQHALGERQSAATAQGCFACHTTASSMQGRFDPAHAIPGVTCEACHGPGATHVQAMREGRVEDGRAAILNPARLGAIEQLDFCGACHRTPADVKAAKDFVPLNIRFQPYRLAKSRCWSRPDARLSCIACHNPHQDPVEDVRWYDAKCLACHAKGPKDQSATMAPTGEASGCPVSRERCVSCHMPRYQVSQLHASFTDHFIRIVRPGDPYPL
jgi:hypothetical protein